MSIARNELTREGFKGITTGRKLAAVHPGAVLLADFIEPMQITRYRVAKAIGVQHQSPKGVVDDFLRLSLDLLRLSRGQVHHPHLVDKRRARGTAHLMTLYRVKAYRHDVYVLRASRDGLCPKLVEPGDRVTR